MMDLDGKQLDEAVYETFEQIAFMDTETVPKPPDIGGVSCFTSSITLDAPVAGKMVIVASGTLLESVGKIVFADMLDSMPSPDEGKDEANAETETPKAPLFEEEQLGDIVNELLNTLAGDFLKRKVSDQETFSIGFPVHENKCQQAWDSTWHYYDIDNEFFAAKIELD